MDDRHPNPGQPLFESGRPGAWIGRRSDHQQPRYTHIERALFPALPYSFSAAITHVPLVPADFGSCVKAISVGRPITCPDIQSDRLFDPRWRQVCLDHGLRAIQSRPIFVDGKPRGTFVLAFREPKSESDWDVALMTFAADAASKALSNSDT